MSQEKREREREIVVIEMSDELALEGHHILIPFAGSSIDKTRNDQRSLEEPSV